MSPKKRNRFILNVFRSESCPSQVFSEIFSTHMSGRDVEATLSRSRLKLMDKKKEVRECVHEHYLDLVGVADHAIEIERNAEAIMASYDRLLSLSRSLRMRATSVQLSAPVAHSSKPSNSSGITASPLAAMNSWVSRRANILFHANNMHFRPISEILSAKSMEAAALEGEKPDKDTSNLLNDILALETGEAAELNDLVVSCCWRALSSPNLITQPALVDCITLLRQCATELSLGEFWQRRTELVSKSLQAGDQLKFFDLTVSGALASDMILDSEFVSQLTGLLSKKVGEALTNNNPSLHESFERYIALKDSLEDFRKSASINCVDDRFDIANTVLDVIRTISEQSVTSALSGIQIDKLKLEVLVKSTTGLVSELTRFGVYSQSQAEDLVGSKLHFALSESIKDSDLENVKTGMHAAELAFALQEGQMLGQFSSASIRASLESLAGDSFDWFFDNICLGTKVSDFPVTVSQYAMKNVYNYGTGKDDVLVPSRLSPQVMGVIFAVIQELVDLPNFCWAFAGIDSAKSALIRFFTSYFTIRIPTPNLQTLFDASSLVLLCSCSKSTEAYNFFSKTVYMRLEESVLADSVDSLLYKDLIKVSAFESALRNINIFQPLFFQNPLYMHFKATVGQTVAVSPGSLLESLVGRGEKASDRFPSLPVGRTPVQQKVAEKPKKSAPQVAEKPSITSFFNQVGRITLGSKP